MISRNQPAASVGVNQRLVSRTHDSDMKGRLDSLNETESTSTTSGAYTTKGGAGIGKNLFVGGNADIHKGLFLGSAISDITGDRAILPAMDASVIFLDGSGLVSLAGIVNAPNKLILLVNRTGGTVGLINDFTPEEPESFDGIAKILTGTDSDFPLPKDGLVLLYNGSNGICNLVAGGGGAGGAISVATITERDALIEAVRYQGLEVFVIENGLYYYLAGGITNANWKSRLPSQEGNVGKVLMTDGDSAYWGLGAGLVSNNEQVFNADALMTLQNVPRQLCTIRSETALARTATLPAADGLKEEIFVTGSSDSMPAQINGIAVYKDTVLHFVRFENAWKLVRGS